VCWKKSTWQKRKERREKIADSSAARCRDIAAHEEVENFVLTLINIYSHATVDIRYAFTISI
jgi:hypothetical protein